MVGLSATTVDNDLEVSSSLTPRLQDDGIAATATGYLHQHISAPLKFVGHFFG
jgi:hypothetical protein